MNFQLVPILMTCSPAVLCFLALGGVMWEYKRGTAKRSAVVAVCGALLIAVYAAWVYVYYTLKPPPDLPPWKDPEILDLGVLGLVAPLGLVTAFVAARRGASIWVVLLALAALVILTFVGLLEAAAV